MQVYELCFLILPSIAEEKLPDVEDSIRKIIAKEGGTEIEAEAPFTYPLAYSMSKNVGASHYVVNEAYLGWIKFELEPTKILAVKADLDKIGEILRFLLIKARRETTFTFAEARLAKMEKEEENIPAPSLAEEVVV